MEPERIEFPADYPIKVVARAAPDLRSSVDEVFRRHFGDFAAHRVTERPSTQSNFLALTYSMRVDSAAQLSALHADLKILSAVVLVL
jgi:putative lipoic acid-binding regulatory protein